MYGIFTYIWVIYGANVSKYASTMDDLGMVTFPHGQWVEKGSTSTAFEPRNLRFLSFALAPFVEAHPGDHAVHLQFRLTMGKPWENHGKTMGKWSHHGGMVENYRKTIGKSHFCIRKLEIYRKMSGKPIGKWENHGKTIGKWWFSMGLNGDLPSSKLT